MRKSIIAFALSSFLILAGNIGNTIYGEPNLEQIKTRPDMVVLIPNGGVVMVYRDKWGSIITEEYYSVRVQDQGIGLCDDLGKGDIPII